MKPAAQAVALVFALALTATTALGGCQNASSPDAMPLPDAAIGVRCAGNLCTTDTGCCLAAGSGTPACVTTAGGACTGKLLKCDGPEDCTSGDACCVLTAGGGTRCESFTACAMEGVVECNSDVDCGGATPTCCNHACASGCNYW